MIVVLLPVYNEEGNIGKLLDKFIKVRFIEDLRIVLINDGSKDGSKKLIQSYSGRLPITLINHETNKGVTEVLKTGFKEIMKFLKPDDLLITMDGDNTHDPHSINQILERFNQGYDLINASRFCKQGMMIGVPPYRLFFSYACKLILTRVFPIENILDYSGFYRGYRGSLIHKAVDFYGDSLFQTQGFVGFPELLIKLSKFKPRAIEFPIVLRYDAKIGASKMKLVRTIKSYLYMINLLKRKGAFKKAN